MIEFQVEDAFNPELSDTLKRLVYNGIDCLVTEEIHQNLHGHLHPDAQRAYDFEMRMLPPLLHASLRGVVCDQEARAAQRNLLHPRITRVSRFLGNQLRSLVPQEEWIKLAKPKQVKVDSVPYKRIRGRYWTRPLSPSDTAKGDMSPILLQKILYDYLGLPEKKGKDKSKKRSTDDEALSSLLKDPKTKRAGAHRLVRAVQLYQELSKQFSYVSCPLRKGRNTFTISPGKETFRIAAQKDPVTTEWGVVF